MSDRVKGFVVVLDKDYRDDGAEYIENAIKMIKGVKEVTPSIVNSEDLINRMRITSEIKEKIYDLMEKI